MEKVKNQRKFLVSILCSVLCFVMLVCSALLLVGCGDTDPGDGGTTPPGDTGKYEVTLEVSGNGRITTIEEYKNSSNDTMLALKPVANEGSYFLKWEVSSGDSPYFAYSAIYNAQKKSDTRTTLKAIFTDDESEICYYEMHIEAENDVPVEVEYLPYVNRENPLYSFYAKKNDNAVLSKLSLCCDEPGNPFIINSILVSDHLHTLPYSTAGQGFEGSMLLDVYLSFSDLREKNLVTIQAVNKNGSYGWTKYQICEKNTTQIITPYDTCTWDIKPTGNDANEYDHIGSYLYEWKDGAGNVISTDKYLEVMPRGSETFYACFKEADETLFVESGNTDTMLVFSQNADATLTIEGFYVSNTETFVVPTHVNGKKVTGISNCLFADEYNHFSFLKHLELPETIVNFGDKAFAYYKVSGFGGLEVKVLGDKENLRFSMFEGAEGVKFQFTDKTIENMIKAQIDTLVKDSGLEVSFVDQAHLGSNVLGHYEMGSKKICVMSADKYTVSDLWVFVHELRHFYQEVAIENVSGLSLSDLIVPPTDNQVGAWKNLEYTSSDDNYDKYWYNAREVDAREYATLVLGTEVKRATTNYPSM